MTRTLDLLSLVVERGKLSMIDAAHEMGVTKQRASELTRRLFQAGMVTKHADPLNGNYIILKATKAGRYRIKHPRDFGDV